MSSSRQLMGPRGVTWIAGYLGLCFKAALLLQLTQHTLGASDKFRLNGAYSGYLGRANMGDELVLDVFAVLLAQGLQRQAANALGHNNTVIEIDNEVGGVLSVNSRGTRTSQAKSFNPNYRNLDFAVLGGGSLLDPTRTRWGEFCERVRSRGGVPMYMHATGTQIDSERQDILALRCIKKPAFGGLRGPRTVALLKRLIKAWERSYGAGRDASRYFNTELPIISDSGILTSRLFPRHVGPLVHQVDANLSPNGVVCISGLPNGLDAMELVRSWVGTYTVILMPVDHVTYSKLNSKLKSGLEGVSPALRERVFLNKHVTHYGVWLALLDRCDLMLTSRLHAMILSASAQTRFRLFQESHRSQIKMADFLANTFDEPLEAFRLPEGWNGSLAEVGVLLGSEEEGRKWDRRYSASYEEEQISKPYGKHLKAMGEFLDYLIKPAKYRGVTRVKATFKRYFDGATVSIALR